MVNIHRDPHSGTAEITVNLRAPIIVDTASRVATQPILANPDYGIRHPLRRLEGAHAADRAEP
jgi:flagellar assembly factor FliW